MPIRANLRALMEHHRVSQYALAKAAGVPQPTIQRILSGESEDPKTATVGRLARVFGVTVEDLRGTAEGLRLSFRDGLGDIVRTFQGAQTLLLGTGRGWTRDDSYSNSLATNGIMSLDSDRKNQGLMPIDFDDDGLVDYLVAKEGGEPRAYLGNTGMSWEQSAEMTQILSSLSVVFATSKGASTGVTFADIGGNGISDIVMAKNGDRRLWLASGLRSGLMVRATGALGEVIEIEWASSASFNNTSSEGVHGLPNPMPVVTAITHRDGRGNAFQSIYEYAGGLFENRQLRGFAWSRQWLPSKLRVETWYHQEEGIAAAIANGYERVTGEMLQFIKKNWTDATLKEVKNFYGMDWSLGLALDILIRHEIHHRGQMTVLMRQAGLKVPGVYGPSKEEWVNYGAPAPEI